MKSAGKFLFSPLNHIRITPGVSELNEKNLDKNLSTPISEANIIDGLKDAGEISLDPILTSIQKPHALVHSKSTGNLWAGGMRKIKEALRFSTTSHL